MKKGLTRQLSENENGECAVKCVGSRIGKRVESVN